MEHFNGTYEHCDCPGELVKLDAVGADSLQIISGTIKNDVQKDTHWIAQVCEQKGDYFKAKIVHKEGYTDEFFYQEVEVVLQHHTKPNTFTFRFLPSDGPVACFKQVSKYYWTVSVTIDNQEGIKPVTSFNPCVFDDAPSDLPNKEIHLCEVFANAGVEVDINEERSDIPFKSDGYFQAWNDDLLHTTMEQHWCSYREEPQWAVWVFCAGRHAKGLKVLGKMFDDIGPYHRQGVAVFYHAIESDVPGNIFDQKQRKLWQDRMKFWTLCHELGHSFNLRHTWDSVDVHNWITDQDQPQIANFMHYPNQAPWNAHSYFKSFRYQFSLLNLLLLRHSSELNVRMGDAVWKH